MGKIGEKSLKEILVCAHYIGVSGSSLKAFSVLHYLKAVKLCHNDKNFRLNQRNREIQKLGRERLLNQREKILSFFPLSKQAVKVNSQARTIRRRDLYFKLAF